MTLTFVDVEQEQWHDSTNKQYLYYVKLILLKKRVEAKVKKNTIPKYC